MGVRRRRALQRQFPSAGAEFRVAYAGPLVTLVLGAAFVAGATLLHLPAPVDAVLGWLGLMNLFLFAFNMLAAVPLDGGRVLHSALWKLRGSCRRQRWWPGG